MTRSPAENGRPISGRGTSPTRTARDDGFARTAPVATFPPNGFGLYDIAGNVWEWCSDWYRPGYETERARDPAGPKSSYDPDEPGVPKRVQRGGSFLCSDQYCTRYLPGARGKGAPDSAASHVGFRCVLITVSWRRNVPNWLSYVYNWLFSEFLTHLGFLLALVLMAGLLRQRRSPSSTIAWLLVILLLPYLGVPLYIMFGGRKIKRMAQRKAADLPAGAGLPRRAIKAEPWSGCSPRMACRRPPPATGSSWSPRAWTPTSRSCG